MTGAHGASESAKGTLFKTLLLFEADRHVPWQRRDKTFDPITGIETDAGSLTEMGLIWGSYTPNPKETFDRQVHINFATGNFLTNADVKLDDMVAGKRVSRVDILLGLRYLTLG